jgi:hypothetical protein
MATCSADVTCKIWKISSYQNDINQVKESLQATQDISNRMDGYIDVLNESFNDQLTFTEPQTLKVGDLPISSGYHADLRYVVVM